MSQRKFFSGEFDVLAGFDRPMGTVFFDLFKREVPKDEDDFVYSSMYDPKGARTPEEVVDELTRRGVKFPDALLEDLRQDFANRDMSTMMRYPEPA